MLRVVKNTLFFTSASAVALWMAMLVGPDWNISTTIGWIVITCGPQRMNPTNLRDPMIIPQAPPAVQSLFKVFAYAVKSQHLRLEPNIL